MREAMGQGQAVVLCASDTRLAPTEAERRLTHGVVDLCIGLTANDSSLYGNFSYHTYPEQ